MNVLVTGGGGFLGSHIARALRERGDDVTVFGRRRYPALERGGIRGIQADVRDAGAVFDACRGTDAVFHVAARVGIWGPRLDYWKTNVNGTRNVIEGCRAARVGRLIFTSTPSAVFSTEELCGADESQPYAPRHLTAYSETKAEAERMVLGATDDALRTIAIRPHLVWGPHDPNLIPRIAARAGQGRLVQVGKGDNLVDITYIDNAVHAHLLACDALGRSEIGAGRAYFVSDGRPVRLWPWLNQLLAALGVPGVRRRVSFRAAYAAGAVLEAAYRVVGRADEPPMTRFLACQLARSHYFSIEGAGRDLGYAPIVSTDEGLRRLAAWWPDRASDKSEPGAPTPPRLSADSTRAEIC